MGKPKAKSKRVTLKLKYNIKKHAKEKRRKLAKMARDNPNLVRQTKRDPGIPNLWPFKDALIEQEEKRREKLSEEQKRQKESRQRAQEKKRKQAIKVNNVVMPAPERELLHNPKGQQRAKWYMKELRKVIDDADIILEVLDARDPLGCRSPAVERLIQGRVSERSGKPKRIILVLNKIDLVPAEVVEKWVNFLRREFPCVAFKSSTQKSQAEHTSLGQSTSGSMKQTIEESQKERHTCIGGVALLSLLKQYSLSLNLKTAISVAVIGYPNVGKSSVINSLKRSKAVGVSSTAGFTKSLQRIRLDKHIELIDSPGVLFDAEQSESELVLRNALKVEQVEDPVEAVQGVVNKCQKVGLMQIYEIADFNTVEEFLFRVAQKRGKLGKGGVPDIKSGAVCVLRDWNEGKIPYYTSPPESKVGVSEAQIVSSWGTELKIDHLLDESNKQALGSLKSVREGTHMPMAASMPRESAMAIDGEDDEESDSEDELGKITDSGRSSLNGSGANGAHATTGDVDMDASENGDAHMDASDDDEEDPSADAMDTSTSTSLVELKAPAAKKGGAQKPAPRMFDPTDALTPQLNRNLKKQQQKGKKDQRRLARTRANSSSMDTDDAPSAAGSAAAAPAAAMVVKPFDPNAEYDFEQDYQ